MSAAAYGADYFRKSCGRPYKRDEHWLGFFAKVADHIVEEIRPTTVLDAGCAMGFLVEALRDRGVEAWGVDISKYAISKVRPDIREYCRVASVTDPLERVYDLIVCIEVLEHLPAADGALAIDNFCAHAREVLFSSTPEDVTETTHVNVQPTSYWASAFAQRGFLREVDFDASDYLNTWALRLRKAEEPLVDVVSDYERLIWQLKKERRQLQEREQQLAAQNQRRDAELAEKDAQMGSLRHRVAQLEEALQAIESSRSYQLARGIRDAARKIAPEGSGRDRLLRSVGRGK